MTKGKYVYLDIETRQSFEDVGGYHPESLNMSIGVTYSPKSLFKHWEEQDVSSLIKYLNQFEFVIGYNLLEFDYRVLGSYHQSDEEIMESLRNKTVDLLFLIEEELGKRISLDEIAKATLNKKKSGNGLRAIKLWREGEIEKLKRYCEDDVKLTVALFEYVQKTQCLYYTSYGKKTKINISLPEGAEIAELNIEKFKIELNAFFEVLFSGETISKNQLKLLKDKTDILIEYIENSAQDTSEDEYDESDADDEDDDDDEYSSNSNQNEDENQGSSSYSGNGSDLVDDLPF